MVDNLSEVPVTQAVATPVQIESGKESTVLDIIQTAGTAGATPHEVLEQVAKPEQAAPVEIPRINSKELLQKYGKVLLKEKSPLSPLVALGCAAGDAPLANQFREILLLGVLKDPAVRTNQELADANTNIRNALKDKEFEGSFFAQFLSDQGLDEYVVLIQNKQVPAEGLLQSILEKPKHRKDQNKNMRDALWQSMGGGENPMPQSPDDLAKAIMGTTPDAGELVAAKHNMNAIFRATQTHEAITKFSSLWGNKEQIAMIALILLTSLPALFKEEQQPQG